MTSESLLTLIEDWKLKGLGAGFVLGMMLEVAAIRAQNGRINWPLTLGSMVVVSLVCWVAYDTCCAAIPDSPWKPLVFAMAISSNTWLVAKVIAEGTMLQLLAEAFLPQKMKEILRRRHGDKK